MTINIELSIVTLESISVAPITIWNMLMSQKKSLSGPFGIYMYLIYTEPQNGVKATCGKLNHHVPTENLLQVNFKRL